MNVANYLPHCCRQEEGKCTPMFTWNTELQGFKGNNRWVQTAVFKKANPQDVTINRAGQRVVFKDGQQVRVDAENYLLNENGGRKISRYIKEIKTGDLYWPDSQELVVGKCAGITLGIIPWALVRMVWNVAKIPLDLILPIVEKGKKLTLKGYAIAIWTNIVKDDIWTVVKTPFIAIAILFVAPFGIAFPFEARKVIGKLEHQWHSSGLSYKDDMRLQPDNPVSNATELLHLLHRTPVYMALCFQRRGNISNPLLEEIPQRSQAIPLFSGVFRVARD